MHPGGTHTSNRKLKKLLSSKLAQNTLRATSNGASGKAASTKKKIKSRASREKLKLMAAANGSTSQMSEATQASHYNKTGMVTDVSHMT